MIQSSFFSCIWYPVAPAPLIDKTVHLKLIYYKPMLPQFKKKKQNKTSKKILLLN